MEDARFSLHTWTICNSKQMRLFNCTKRDVWCCLPRWNRHYGSSILRRNKRFSMPIPTTVESAWSRRRDRLATKYANVAMSFVDSAYRTVTTMPFPKVSSREAGSRSTSAGNLVEAWTRPPSPLSVAASWRFSWTMARTSVSMVKVILAQSRLLLERRTRSPQLSAM